MAAPYRGIPTPWVSFIEHAWAGATVSIFCWTVLHRIFSLSRMGHSKLTFHTYMEFVQLAFTGWGYMFSRCSCNGGEYRDRTDCLFAASETLYPSELIPRYWMQEGELNPVRSNLPLPRNRSRHILASVFR